MQQSDQPFLKFTTQSDLQTFLQDQKIKSTNVKNLIENIKREMMSSNTKDPFKAHVRNDTVASSIAEKAIIRAPTVNSSDSTNQIDCFGFPIKHIGFYSSKATIKPRTRETTEQKLLEAWLDDLLVP